MSGYLEWNDRLARYFFRPDMAGRTVSLYVNADVIDEVAPPTHGLSDFIAAVKLGPAFAAHGGLCERAMRTYERWRERPGLEFPPYIAYLALFVLAAGTEGEFAANAYYPRLRALIETPGDGQLSGFSQMLELWDDLERWSVQDSSGELGVFTVRRSGKWVHVGVPLGQTVLTEAERRALPAAFCRAGLDPVSPISDDALANSLRVHGSGILSNKTIARLGKQRDVDMLPVLVDAIAQELADWDGQFRGDGAEAEIFAPLRLCVELDAIAGRVRCALRCRTSMPIPQAGLTVEDGAQTYLIAEELVGWSAPLQKASGHLLDVGSVDWERGISASSDPPGWIVRWPGAPVRLLASGKPEGVPGLVEVFTIGSGRGLAVAFNDTAAPRIKTWSSRSCEGFKEIAVSGLPRGWRIATIDRVRPDRLMLGHFPVLAGDEAVRIQFAGGVRSGTGSSYLAFALPEVVAIGLEDGDHVLVNGIEASLLETGHYSMPRESADADHVVVEVRRGEDSLRSQSLWIVRDFDWRASSRAPIQLDSKGERADEPVPGISGAFVHDTSAVPAYPASDPLLADGLQGATRVFFIGRRVGEIADWPREKPSGWPAIWGVVPGHSLRFVFCAPPEINPEPVSCPSGRPREQRAWKELLWYRRKRAGAVKGDAARRLLRAYREIARNA